MNNSDIKSPSISTNKTIRKGIIYVLLEQPFDERNYRRLGIEYLFLAGWDVYVYNITPLVVPEYQRRFNQSGGKVYCYTKYKEINSHRELFSQIIKNSNPDFYIDYCGDTTISSFLAKLMIQNKGGRRIEIRGGSAPHFAPVTDSPFKGVLDKCIKTICKLTKYSILRTLVIISHRLLIKNDIVVVSGKLSQCGLSKYTKVIYAFSLDYDLYVKSKNKMKSKYINPYAVYIDQNLTNHPGFLYINEKPPATIEGSMIFLHDFMSRLRKLMGIDILIAAHPRSDMETLEKNYNGYKILNDETVDLVRDAEFVIGHYSTSLQYAVFFNKPILILTTDELSKSNRASYIQEFCKALGCKILNICHEVSADDIKSRLRISSNHYKNYIDSYAKAKNTPQQQLWEIVENNIYSEISISS